MAQESMISIMIKQIICDSKKSDFPNESTKNAVITIMDILCERFKFFNELDQDIQTLGSLYFKTEKLRKCKDKDKDINSQTRLTLGFIATNAEFLGHKKIQCSDKS